MRRWTIRRIAFLEEYTNRPATLRGLIGEVAGKGYRAAAFSVSIEQEQAFAELAGRREVLPRTANGGKIEIDVEFTYNDCVKVFAFF